MGVLVKDRYLVEKELGRGGFAVTYLASDTQLDSRPVVVKILLEHHAENRFVLKKFHHEMQALARLDHPGVVGALDTGELPNGNPFLVMQFIKGVTLREVITPLGMDLEHVAHIVRQLGQALSVAHQAGICHRDVKPENIMLQSLGEGEEQAKLIDFGIASIRDAQVADLTPSTIIPGSWRYMAPEQFEGKKASPASDVYALGVVAYEMVTGRRPFNAEAGLVQLVMLQRQGVKVKPKDLRPGLPEAAQDVIWKALARNPEERYARARDFGEALAKALTDDAAETETDAPVVEGNWQQPLEIAHVLFMDLVAHATLPIDQQKKHVQLLQRIVGETPDFAHAKALHQLMSLPAGDGMALVFFVDAMAPVRCALSIATALKNHPDLKLRMGLNSGPVYRNANINVNSDVVGGGIIMAQRAMDCGDAGHILLSRTIAEVIGAHTDWAAHLQDLGEHTVKNGAKVHVYNLCTGELGNPAVPEKLRPSPGPEAPEPKFGLLEAPSENRFRRVWVPALVILGVAIAGAAWWTRAPAVREKQGAGASLKIPVQAPPSEAAPPPKAAEPPPAAAAVAPAGGNASPVAPVTTDGQAAGRTKVNPKDGLTYVWVPPGAFTMGCSPADTECSDGEKPAHPVNLTKGFWIGQTEVTQEAYQRVAGKKPSHFRGDRLPVENVNWNEAQAYCKAAGMRLPTEAEWEYAARGGSTANRPGDLDAVAWYSGNSEKKTQEVAQRQPNGYGLYDMLGNVWEWVADWHDERYYQFSQPLDPQGPSNGDSRTQRGGSWYNIPKGIRVSNRLWRKPGNRFNDVGFRCAGE